MLAARLTAGDYLGAYARHLTLIERRIEFAALKASDGAARRGTTLIRAGMQEAKLGRLGNAVGANSDLSKGRGVHRSAGGFSASGAIFVRSKSERTLGAIEAYTQGAKIAPVRGRWLWIPTPEIQRLAGSGKGRQRVAPGNWEKLGLDRKIGPLVVVKSINGRPLLVVKDASVGSLGQKGSARALTKRGTARKGFTAKTFIVAFIAIPRTARAARINIVSIMAKVQGELPALFAAALREG